MFRSITSEVFIANSGVPQGSHLGPILFIIAINDVSSVLANSSITIYADDMKIFKVISNPLDCSKLQLDLDLFLIWCFKNDLTLNINKCHSITFSRKKSDIPFVYKLNNTCLTKIDFVKDLGVICDSQLNFGLHIDHMVNKANSVMGFIKRWSKEFSDPYITKVLYLSFVRPIVEYACQVWSPYKGIHINRIESVQKKFLRFALRGLGWVDPYNLPPYYDRLKLINLPALSYRREVLDVIFIHQILSGAIDSPQLLQNLSLNAKTPSLRSTELFKLDFHRTQYGQFEPITRMLRTVNNNKAQFDFNLSKFALKRELFK